MSTAMPQTDRIPKPTLSQRIRSWKWWVYGDLNSMPREKPPKWYRAQFVIGLFFWVLLGVHPWIATWINAQPPNFSDLQIVHGKVINTSRKSPHLGIKTETGEIISMEYPGFLTNYGSSPGGTRSLGRENERVLGCVATVWFDVPKYTLWVRYRIWQIKCDNGQASALYEELLAISTSSMGLVFWAVTVFLFMPFFMFIYLIRYRRGYYER